MDTLKEDLKRYAAGVGLDLIGFTTAEPFDRYLRELDAREEHYAARYGHRLGSWRRFGAPREVMPEARSVIVVGFYYLTDDPAPDAPCGRLGRIVSYGHLGILRRARRLRDELRRRGFKAEMGAHRKEAAVRAGLGAIGKNDLVMNNIYGGWVAYQSIITDAALAPDAPCTEDPCAHCDLCLRACPTGALYEPRRVDPRRCVTCLLTGAEVAEEDWPRLGPRILGCDACLEACPKNKSLVPREYVQSAFPEGIGSTIPLVRLLALTEETFQRDVIAPLIGRFAGRAWLGWLMRFGFGRRLARRAMRVAKGKETLPETFMMASDRLEVFKRNALIAAGNLGDPALLEEVNRFKDDPYLGKYARWAAERMESHDGADGA